jgi:hypothetical protein
LQVIKSRTIFINVSIKNQIYGEKVMSTNIEVNKDKTIKNSEIVLKNKDASKDSNSAIKKSGFIVNISDEILEELVNLNGKLEKIKIPTGGGTSFKFPNF